MAMDPLSMKSVLDRVELLEKSYQEERLAVRTFRGTLRGASKVCPNALAGARRGRWGVFLPSHLRPRPGTASAVDRLSIHRNHDRTRQK